MGMSLSVRLHLISRESAVGVELPAGEDQSDQVDEGSNPTVGGRLKGHGERKILDLVRLVSWSVTLTWRYALSAAA